MLNFKEKELSQNLFNKLKGRFPTYMVAQN